MDSPMTKEEYEEYFLYTNRCVRCGRIFKTEDCWQAYCQHCEEYEDKSDDV